MTPDQHVYTANKFSQNPPPHPLLPKPDSAFLNAYPSSRRREQHRFSVSQEEEQ